MGRERERVNDRGVEREGVRERGGERGGRERELVRERDRQTDRHRERETARVHRGRDSIAGFMVPLASVETSSDTVYRSAPF